MHSRGVRAEHVHECASRRRRTSYSYRLARASYEKGDLKMTKQVSHSITMVLVDSLILTQLCLAAEETHGTIDQNS